VVARNRARLFPTCDRSEYFGCGMSVFHTVVLSLDASDYFRES